MICLIFAGLCDMFDGKIARKYNYITDFGKFIDPIADKMLVLCVLVAFIECNLVSCTANTIPIEQNKYQLYSKN